jgi:hypothetical protein
MCDLAYLIQDHLPAVFQLFSNEPDLAPYGIGGSSRTKCLSTAVLMMYLYLGRDAMQHTAFCDVPNVRKRYETADHSLSMIDHLIADIVDGTHTDPVAVIAATNPRAAPAAGGGLGVKAANANANANANAGASGRMRTLYYVMITDGRLPPAPNKAALVAQWAKDRLQPKPASAKAAGIAADVKSSAAAAARKALARSHHAVQPAAPPQDHEPSTSEDGSSYWPGHVFVLDRQPRGTVNMLQAYINSYDLKGVIQMNRSVSMSRKVLLDRLNDIKAVFSSPIWTPESTIAWERVSHVNEHGHEGNLFQGRVLMCYSRVDSPTCIAQLRKYVTVKLADLRALLKGLPDLQTAVYGNVALYRPADKHLTNAEMLRELEALLDKM